MRLLRANEIECRVGQQSKDKTKYSVLLYKTARCDMAILDEVYGENNWQVEYQMVGSQMFCTIKIWDEDKHQWIAKQSNGTESNMEAEKGQASDAFKRAGFMLGIGRELYSAPRIWLDAGIDQYSLEVTEIEYDENREIKKLVISSKGNIVYTFPHSYKPKTNSPTPMNWKPLEAYDKLRAIYNNDTALKTKLVQLGCTSRQQLTPEIYNLAVEALGDTAVHSA